MTLTGRRGITRNQLFTASGSFVVPPGVTLVTAQLCGGGGGGGGGSATSGAGGGGGGSGLFVVRQVAVTDRKSVV